MAVPPMPGLWNWPNPLAGLGVRGPAEGEGAGLRRLQGRRQRRRDRARRLVRDRAGRGPPRRRHGRLAVRAHVAHPRRRGARRRPRSQTVQIDLTKQQIKDAPEYDKSAGYGAYRDCGDRVLRPDDVAASGGRELAQALVDRGAHGVREVEAARGRVVDHRQRHAARRRPAQRSHGLRRARRLAAEQQVVARARTTPPSAAAATWSSRARRARRAPPRPSRSTNASQLSCSTQSTRCQ